MSFRFRDWIVVFISVFIAVVPVKVSAGSMTLLGAGSVGVAATYQGPGDVVSGASIWGSCARVYNASLASTATSLCDLVDSASPTTVICTLRGTASGFVDLTGAYCTGAVTPVVKCAAATGGKCNVEKVYDQIGGTSGWTNVTAASQPTLTFSAINSLPGLTSLAASNTVLQTSSTFTISQPYSWEVVGERTSAFTTQNALIGASGAYAGGVWFTTSASTIAGSGNGSAIPSVTGTCCTDSAFHAVQMVVSSGSAQIASDGTTNTASGTTAAMSANTSRIMRISAGVSLSGVWMEGGLWPVGFDSTQQTNMNSNIHGTSGYNF